MAAITLPPNVIKNLGDRSYEKRKQAALEIEHLIKDWNAVGGGKNATQILSLVSLLSNDYAYSTQSNYRKGGLIGLAATAIALGDDTPTYLNLLLPPVLKCFTDPESRVRYYACEALYNITKVARGAVLVFFNELFDGLTKLYSDVDADVKNGAHLLDRLLKDVVTESEAFQLDKFIPLLGERIKIKNPFIRQLLVGWISVLDSVPDIDLLESLPEFLGGLFDMLSDPNKDIRQQSYAVLAELLREITQSVQAQLQAAAQAQSSGVAPPPSSSIDLPAMILILVKTCTESRDNFTRLTVLTWINEFLFIGSPNTLLPFVADMLGVALQAISDSEKEIRQKAERTNEMLLHLVQCTDQPLNLVPLLEKLTAQLHNKFIPSRLASLRWISMLLSKLPGGLQAYLEFDLFPVLLRTLLDQDDLVVKYDLEVLAKICLDANWQIERKQFSMVLHHLLNLFKTDRKFLEIRGSFIIRSLCDLLDAEEIYRTLSEILAGEAAPTSADSPPASSSGAARDVAPAPNVVALASGALNEDFEFSSLMVQTLNLILLTSMELAPLRNRLKNALNPHSSEQGGLDLFQCLYKSWVHNPIATFSLCLLTQTYSLSSSLILRIAQVDISVNYLMQIDKLIQLLESPIFIHLRLKLLEEPTANNNVMFLLKSLYGVLMLLPQSSAFTSLKTRLESVAPLVMLMKEGGGGGGKASSKKEAERAPDANSPAAIEAALPLQQLIAHFESVQAKHAARKQRMQKQTSLIRKGPTTNASPPGPPLPNKKK